MRVFNRFKVTRRAAYVIVELGFSVNDEKPDDLGEQTETFTVPITTSASLAVDLFKATIESSATLTEYFIKLAKSVADLNALSQEVEKKKAEMAGVADAKEGT